MRIYPSYTQHNNNPSFAKRQQSQPKAMQITIETGLANEPVFVMDKNITVETAQAPKIKKNTEKKKEYKTAILVGAASTAALMGVSGAYFYAIRKYESKLFNEISKKTRSYYKEIIPELKDKIKNLTLKTKDNVNIDCWNIRPTNPQKNPKYVVFCNGSGCDKTTKELQSAYNKFSDAGYGVIAFDYRGTGRSEGVFSEKGVFSDIEAIFDHLKSQGVAQENIGLAGHSLGTALAVNYAAKNKTAFTMLINPFTKGSELAKEAVNYFEMPKVVKQILKKMPSQGVPLKNEFNTISKIGKVDSPLFILHTVDDNAISVEMARELRKKAKSPTYQELETGGHDMCNSKVDECIKFLNNLFTK